LELLGLGNSKFTGTIPDCTKELTSLRSLSLYNNFLTGSAPLLPTSLVNIYLGGNGLTGTLDPFISLYLLEAFLIDGNRLSGTIPNGLGDLTLLGFLALDQNLLSGTVPSELGKLTALTVLSLYNNTLSGQLPSEINALTQMTSLFVALTGLTGDVTKLCAQIADNADLSPSFQADCDEIICPCCTFCCSPYEECDFVSVTDPFTS
jgi:Leucine-rich repeat (LRR) protein